MSSHSLTVIVRVHEVETIDRTVEFQNGTH